MCGTDGDDSDGDNDDNETLMGRCDYFSLTFSLHHIAIVNQQ